MAKSDISGPSPSVCIIGAGFGGLTVAIQLKRKLGLETFTIFEKNDDVGGTWLVNTYPGAQCDIPSLFYSWSFEPNYEWTGTFASQPEILEYMRNTAKKYDLYPHLKTNSPVISCIWIEKSSKWEVKWVDNKSGIHTMTLFDFVVVGVSFLWNPNIPEIFDNFKGVKMHSAQWDHNVDLENKIVGVVGSGASAVQLIPKIAGKVKELHSFQRTPTWVYPKPLNFDYGKSFRWIARNFKFLTTLGRWTALSLLSTLNAAAEREESWAQKFGVAVSKWYMKRETKKKPELFEQIRPSGNMKLFFCRMPSGNSDYISALCSSDAKIHRNEIVCTRDDGVVLENGTEIKLDVLILATGFKITEYFGSLKIIGEQETNVLDSWTQNGVNTYYGVCTKNAKNLFFIYGPQSVVLHSAIFVIECQAKYVTKMISHMMKLNLNVFHVKSEAEAEYLEIRQKIMEKSIFVPERCQSNDRRFFDLICPVNGLVYRKRLSKINPVKFSFK